MFVYELSGCGFESRCSHINLKFCAYFEQGVPWHSGNYRVWIHSKTRTWRVRPYSQMHGTYKYSQHSSIIKESYLASLAKWLSVRLRAKWLWVRVPLQWLKFFFLDKFLMLYSMVGHDVCFLYRIQMDVWKKLKIAISQFFSSFGLTSTSDKSSHSPSKLKSFIVQSVVSDYFQNVASVSFIFVLSLWYFHFYLDVPKLRD